MADYVRGKLEDQFFKSFSQLIRDKQATILAEQPQKTISLTLQQMYCVEKLLGGSQNRPRKAALKIEEHLKDVYRTRIGRVLKDADI